MLEICCSVQQARIHRSLIWWRFVEGGFGVCGASSCVPRSTGLSTMRCCSFNSGANWVPYPEPQVRGLSRQFHPFRKSLNDAAFSISVPSDTAFAISHSSAKYGNALRGLHDLLATPFLIIPDVCFLLSLAVTIEMNHLSLNRAIWTITTKPHETPLDGQVVLGALLALELHEVVIRIEVF